MIEIDNDADGDEGEDPGEGRAKGSQICPWIGDEEQSRVSFASIYILYGIAIQRLHYIYILE